jgi:hypothetical protein
LVYQRQTSVTVLPSSLKGVEEVERTKEKGEEK